MKQTTLLITLLFLISCQKEPSITTPQEQATPKIEIPVETDISQPQQDSISLEDTLQENELPDTIVSDSSTITEMITTLIQFTSPQTKAVFDSLLQAHTQFLFVEKSDSSYILTYLNQDSLEEEILISPFCEQEFSDTLTFSSSASLTIFTPLSTTDHFEPLFFTHNYKGLSLQQRGRVYTLADSLTPFNAFSTAILLNTLAQTEAPQIAALMGPIAGLEEVANSVTPMAQGINPQTKTNLAITLSSLQTPQNPQELQLLSLFGYPYRLTKKSDTLTKVYSYIGNPTQPHTQTITLRHSPTQDPLIELSLGNGDGLLIFSSKTLGLIKSRFKSMNISEIDSRQYFIALTLDTLAQRKALVHEIKTYFEEHPSQSSAVTPIALLAPTLDTLTTESIDTTLSLGPVVTPVLPVQSLSFLVNPEDAKAREIAQEVAHHLQQIGVDITLNTPSFKQYQQKLLAQEYDLTIGAVSQKVMADSVAQKSIAQLYWDLPLSDKERINHYYELPLLKIPVYLAIKKGVTLPDNLLRAIYIEK